MRKKPLIWVNCLVKNEERWIWYALNSVLPLVDKILVWDTGSTDKTVEIIKLIKSRKIEFKQVGKVSQEDYGKVRNQMLKQTKADWIWILDGDEIWPETSLKKLLQKIKNVPDNIYSLCVRPINFVGDIRYLHPETFIGKTPHGPIGVKGFFSNRLFRGNIKGLYAAGPYGKEGFYEQNKKTLVKNRDRNKYLTDVYYWHMSYLPRSAVLKKDREVMMRKRKRKYEIGIKRPDWIAVPEVFYKSRPKSVPSPFYKMPFFHYLIAVGQTPLKKLKRKVTGWKEN
ncbi:hypothetical protein COT75_02890 [Candidatus Beckwithbacteria bacterium CG10_big_fil_rev_8_21_14_0_10_34_10]|uniref:Glycosyltransferase 2-like domain-containing protein n=1 Tax=Candidatus Beckwithbacteria bacterium CG10_big_fil_rev_8_21_14_0_10_34_10 TaxID=1974495 RepID=A0A2H0W943_9BACT|nr:MAG: hypothetical protein COT75_02890 [Candidatus Beckwithbacteria bacterium CG10_big_fil_rev_8_21_14_0_10_34_10]